MKRPSKELSYLAPKLSRPDSGSRSLSVKWRVEGSPQEPEVDWASPKGRLEMVSQAAPVMSLRTRSVPSQSAWLKYVVLLVYVAMCLPPAKISSRAAAPEEFTSTMALPPSSWNRK